MKQASTIKRRFAKQIMVGNVPIGGDAPIAVQSMTNTNTLDVEATVAQIRRLEAVGADIVRVSVPSMDAAEAFGKIRSAVQVPLVSDIHFDYKNHKPLFLLLPKMSFQLDFCKKEIRSMESVLRFCL